MIPCPVVQAAIGGADQIHADAQYGGECRHRIEAAVEVWVGKQFRESISMTLRQLDVAIERDAKLQ